MSHPTEEIKGIGLTNDEQKLLISLLKHSKIKGLAQEIMDEEEKSKKK